MSRDSATGIAHARLAPVLRLPRDAAAPGELRPGQGAARRQLRDVPQPAHRREAGGRAQVLRRCRTATPTGGASRSMSARRTGRWRSAARPATQPHAARVDASDCAGCHESVRKGGGKLRPPLPFDTTKALQQSIAAHRAGPLARARRRPAAGRPARGRRTARPAAPADTFSHARHRRLACITCHTTSSPTRTLTFEPPRGCQICHHQRPASSKCATCHQASELVRAAAGHRRGVGAADTPLGHGMSPSTTRSTPTLPASSATPAR